MGMMNYSPGELKEAKRRWRREERERQMAADKGRRTMAERIAKRVIGKINNDVVRPGPKSEERECTAMAQELRDLEPELVETIFMALKKEDKKLEA